VTAAVGPGAVGLQRRCESGVDVGVVVDVVAEEAALRLPDRVPPCNANPTCIIALLVFSSRQSTSSCRQTYE